MSMPFPDFTVPETRLPGSYIAKLDSTVPAPTTELVASVDHRRALTIKLTDQGRDAFAQMAPIHAEWIVEIFGELPAAEKKALVHKLDNLKKAMNATLSTESIGLSWGGQM